MARAAERRPRRRQYWLVKSEPEAFGWDQQVANRVEPWTGVRNHAAKNNLRAMRAGDRAFFYHSNVRQRRSSAWWRWCGRPIPTPPPRPGTGSRVDMQARRADARPGDAGGDQGRPGAGGAGADPPVPPVGGAGVGSRIGRIICRAGRVDWVSRPTAERALCRLDDIPEGGTRGFGPAPGGFTGLFAVRRGGARVRLRQFLPAYRHAAGLGARPVPLGRRHAGSSAPPTAPSSASRTGVCLRGPCLGDTAGNRYDPDQGRRSSSCPAMPACK